MEFNDSEGAIARTTRSFQFPICFPDSVWATELRAGRTFAVLMGITLALAACTPIRIIDRKPDVITVHMDEGGNIEQRQAEVQRINAAGQRVELRGLCASACLMYLGADDVCVERGITAAFHSARRDPGDPAWADRHFYNRQMAAFYEPAVRNWFYESGASDYRFGTKNLTGADLIAMGVQECGPRR